MKIAIVLRGQPRFIAEGAMLYELFLKNRFKDKYEFKVFGHSWDNVSNRMISTDDDEKCLERELSTELDKKHIIRDINKWGAEGFSVQDETDCSNIVQDIIKQRIRSEKSTNLWFHEYTNEQSFDSLFLLLPNGLEFNRHFDIADVLYDINGKNEELEYKMKMDHIRYTYLLGQLYSAGMGFNQLVEYKNNNPNYEPDIIIATRWDIFIWFHKMEDMLRELNFASTIAPTLYTRRITINDGIPIIDDFVFISNFTGMNKLLGNIKDRLFKSFTQPSYKMFNLVDSGSRLQHLLWTKISDKELNIAQPTNQYWDATVLRPGCINLDGSEPSFSYFNKLKQAQNKYIYPNVGIPPTFGEIDIQWKRLTKGAKS